MNHTVPSPTNWPESGKKKTGIRAIDRGTPYDVSGRMKRWARQLERGELGRPTDMLMVVRTISDNGSVIYEHFSNGTGTSETFAYMAQLAVKRHLP